MSSLHLVETPYPVAVKGRIRYLIERDVDQVLELDSLCFEPTISKEELLSYVNRSVHGVVPRVIELNGKIIGFHIYAVQLNKVEIYRLGVHPDYRRKGFGSRFIADAYKKLSMKRRSLECVVSDHADAAIAFFRSSGFAATGVIRNWSLDGSDGYTFSLILREAIPIPEVKNA